MPAPKFINLTSIEVTSGVNDENNGFCSIRAIGKDNEVVLLAQLSPNDLREHALAFFECAEGAEQDAAVLRTIREAATDDQQQEALNMAAAIIHNLRENRGK